MKVKVKDDASHIEIGPHGQTFVGPDATKLFAAASLRAGLQLYVRTGGKLLMTRGCGVMTMLAMATSYTGKKYTRKQAPQAVDDLKVWCEAMKAALPVVESK